MRNASLVLLVVLFSAPVFSSEEGAPLEGIAYTEAAAKEIGIQVWAIGDQVAKRPDWQIEAVFDGVVSPGKAFSVDLGGAQLPVLVELSAKDHAAVALQVVHPVAAADAAGVAASRRARSNQGQPAGGAATSAWSSGARPSSTAGVWTTGGGRCCVPPPRGPRRVGIGCLSARVDPCHLGRMGRARAGAFGTVRVRWRFARTGRSSEGRLGAARGPGLGRDKNSRRPVWP